MNTKNFVTSLAIAGMLAGGAVPAFAETKITSPEVNQMFCQRITTVESNWTEHLQGKQMSAKGMMEKMKNMLGMRDLRDKQRGGMMEMANKNMDERNTALRAKATTDAEKAAVETFITTMTNAEKARIASVDAAVATYRSGVDAIIAGKTDAGSVAYGTFKTSVESAIATAKTACAVTGADDKAIASAFKTSVQTATKTLKASTADMTAIKASVKALADTRKTAVDTAQEAFKTAVDTARTELEKVMKLDGMMKDMKKEDKKEMKEKREENKTERKEMKDGMKGGKMMGKKPAPTTSTTSTTTTQ